MRGWAWVWVGAVAFAVSGCASTRMLQRDGCWIRQTETFPKQVNEEIGPCSRPEPKWSDDRLARLVQECVAQEDHRWHNQALAAFDKNQPMPPQPDPQNVLRTCMADSAQTLLTENEALKSRIGEVVDERDALRGTLDEERLALRENHRLLTKALGEAAKKPAPAAVATATSNGTANSDTQTKSDMRAPPQSAALIAGGALPMCSGQPQNVLAPTPAPAAKKTVDQAISDALEGKDASKRKAKAKKGTAAERCETPEPELALKDGAAKKADEPQPDAPAHTK